MVSGYHHSDGVRGAIAEAQRVEDGPLYIGVKDRQGGRDGKGAVHPFRKMRQMRSRSLDHLPF